MSDDTPLVPDPEPNTTEPTHSIIDTVLDLDEFLSGDVRRARKSVRISIKPWLEAELDQLDAELDALTDDRGNPLVRPDDEAMAGDGRSVYAVAEQRRRVEQEYAASMRRIDIEQMPSDQWDGWMRANEKKLEANDSAAFDELIVKCAIAPTFTLEQVQKLRSRTGHAVVNEIANAAWAVNTKSGVSVPKSALSSHVLRLQERSRS